MVGEVQWSPDQKWIAVVGGSVMSDGGNLRHAGWVNLCDAKTGKTSHRVRIGDQRVTGLSIAWRTDSNCLVAGNIDGLCQVYEMPNLKTKLSKRVHRLAVQSLSWHPTQERIASGSLDRTVSIWDPNTGDVFVTFTLDAPVEHVCWSPNGVRVAAMDVNGKIYVWDATDRDDLPSVVLNQTTGTSKLGPPPGTS